MRIFILVSIVLLSACEKASQPETSVENVTGHPVYDAETFFDSTQVFQGSDYGWSIDNSKLLVSSNQSGIFNVYEIDSVTGEKAQLTNSTDNANFLASGFPADDRILFSADSGGDELNHVYVREQSGEVVDITPGENLKAMFVRWHEDNRHFFIMTNERNAEAFDLYKVSIDGYDRELVFVNDGQYMPAAPTSNGNYLTVLKQNSNADNDIYLVDLKDTNEPPKLLTPNEVDVQHTVFTYTTDNSKIIYGTDEYSEFTQAWSYDIESGETAPLIEADWDVQYVFFSKSGRYRVSGINEDARTQLTIFDVEKGENLALPELNGSPSSVRFNRLETQISMLLNTDTSPSDLYVMDLASKSTTRLTKNLSDKVDEAALVETQVIRYKSFDDLEIPGILYRPKQASAEAPVPAMIWVHGGPGGQSRTGYSATLQHLVNHGYAVLAANNRGSSGYGKTFFHMDDRRHGEVDLDDIIYAKRYMSTLDWVDADRIGIIGGSYGGYMVGAALAFRPDEFDVGVNIFGVMNWVRTLESIPPWWGPNRDALYAELGDPATDMERLKRISPLFHADNIKVPMLVVQGANDPRVLQVESDEIVEAVRKNGVTVDYLVFEDEGHGFSKKANQIATSDSIVTFLDRELKTKTTKEL